MSLTERIPPGVARQVYGDKATLVGIGYFQTISTRNAGLQLIDLRKCNQARPPPLGTGARRKLWERKERRVGDSEVASGDSHSMHRSSP